MLGFSMDNKNPTGLIIFILQSIIICSYFITTFYRYIPPLNRDKEHIYIKKLNMLKSFTLHIHLCTYIYNLYIIYYFPNFHPQS